MKAIKNRMVEYLYELEKERREKVSQKAIAHGRKQRDQGKRTAKELRKEILRRQQAKKQTKDAKLWKDREKELKKSVDAVVQERSVRDNDRVLMEDLIIDRAVGGDIVMNGIATMRSRPTMAGL